MAFYKAVCAFILCIHVNSLQHCLYCAVFCSRGTCTHSQYQRFVTMLPFSFKVNTMPLHLHTVLAICSGASKQWALEVKLNTAVRSHCFLDELTLATSGVDADVYIWDLRKTGRCVARYWVYLRL